MNQNNVTAIYNNRPVECTIGADCLSVTIPHSTDCGFLTFDLSLADSQAEDFILLPACVYNGNRFACKPMAYPPMFTPAEAKVDMPITVTDVPRLNLDGSGCISVSTGDLATPCIGHFNPKTKVATFLFVQQSWGGVNLGLAYSKGKITLSVPQNRGNNTPCFPHNDKGLPFAQGDVVNIPYRFFQFSCQSMAEFYEFFFTHRKCMDLDQTYSQTLTMAEAWNIHETKWNTFNFEEKLQTYTVGCEYDLSYWGRYQIWQPGWVGGGLSSYPLMKLGNETSYQRGMKTLDFLFSTQQPSGYFLGLVDSEGVPTGDGFSNPGTDDWHMVRKSADILYFMWKHFAVMEEKGQAIPTHLLEGTAKLAEAFVKNFKKYGQVGQFVSHETGDIIVGGSTAGALVPAGLLKCAKAFDRPDYVEIAIQLAKKFYEEFTQKGYTVGGPGEILSNPDSESAFLLLESYICLYEETKDDFWLQAAQEQCHYCASWVVSYNYDFPKTSEFGRLGMKTIGSVFANVQNKHSAPGICTLSGDSVYKLYHYTKNPMYLELISDIAGNIFQYISTNERPIFTRDGGDKPAPSGYINERVNLSDWEGPENVGTIFYGSTWAETSSMLTIAELPHLLDEILKK